MTRLEEAEALLRRVMQTLIVEGRPEAAADVRAFLAQPAQPVETWPRDRASEWLDTYGPEPVETERRFTLAEIEAAMMVLRRYAQSPSQRAHSWHEVGDGIAAFFAVLEKKP